MPLPNLTFAFVPLFIDLGYLMVMIPCMILAGLASMRVKSTFKKFQGVGVRTGMTGAQAAAAVARAGGAEVQIERVDGFLSDHYDPRTRTLRLSPDVYDGRSVSSIAVAAHEAGHAIQHAKSYAFLNMRSKLVPMTIVGSQAWMPAILIGMFMQSPMFWQIGIVLLSVTVLFQLVTLPVEFDASNRAKAVLASSGIVTTQEEAQGVSKVLRAAAMTYVAGAITSVATLLYYLMLFTGGGRDE